MYKQFDQLKFYAVSAFLCLGLVACGDRNRTIKMKGSDTEVNLAANLAEDFSKENPKFSIAISGGGSGLGIAALLNGQADIANSSRPLTEEETEMFKKQNIELKTVVFAEDATVFVVHEDNPVDEIDLTTLAAMLDGGIKNWSEVSGLALPVNIYGRQSSSGTYSFVRKQLKINFCPCAKEMTGNSQILEGVKIDKSGIGYVGAGYISKGEHVNQGVKILKIRTDKNTPAVDPLDPDVIRQRLYYFQRPLYQFIPVDSWEKVAPFIEYETAGKGRIIIENSGYFLLH